MVNQSHWVQSLPPSRPRPNQAAASLRMTASMVLIAPSCLIACAVIGLQLLASVLWPALVWPTMIAIAWLPAIIAGLIIIAVAAIWLLARFPRLLPLLLFVAGLVSTMTLFIAAPLWIGGNDVGAWLIMASGLAGTTLAGWQFRTTRRL